MGVGGIYGCGYWVCFVRRYIDFLILFIPTPLVAICFFLQQHPYFLFIFNVFLYSIEDSIYLLNLTADYMRSKYFAGTDFAYYVQ